MTTSSPPRRLGVALVLSVVAHGLLAVALTLAPTAESAERGVPMAVGVLLLDDPPAVPPTTPDAKAEESEPFIATVADAPPAPTPSSPGTAPVVVMPGAASLPGASHVPTTGVRGVLKAPSSARRIVYAVDGSASMGLPPAYAFAAARDEVLAALDALPSDARVQILLYNRQPRMLLLGGRAELASVTEENRRDAARLLDAVRPEGGTDHASALRAALALEPDCIFLVTDAGDLSPDKVRALTALNRGRAAVHAVELRDGPTLPDAPLALLARLNRGTHRVVAPRPTATLSPLP